MKKKREEKIIGSSLEASIKIFVGKKLFDFVKNYDFSEICITSSAEVILDDKINENVVIETIKAKGIKCHVCWKISETKCERHGHLQ